jgi:hypothetical protein
MSPESLDWLILIPYHRSGTAVPMVARDLALSAARP